MEPQIVMIPYQKISDHLRVKEILDECALLAERKNKDYAKPGDPLHNFRRILELGAPVSLGVACRLQDKWSRIESYFREGKLSNESIKDSLMDNINYSAILIQALEEEEREKISRVPQEDEFGC